jgi:hypothetical protein
MISAEAVIAFDIEDPCAEDCDVSGSVGVEDLLPVISAWGRTN